MTEPKFLHEFLRHFRSITRETQQYDPFVFTRGCIPCLSLINLSKIFGSTAIYTQTGLINSDHSHAFLLATGFAPRSALKLTELDLCDVCLVHMGGI